MEGSWQSVRKREPGARDRHLEPSVASGHHVECQPIIVPQHHGLVVRINTFSERDCREHFPARRPYSVVAQLRQCTGARGER
eukprot:5166460-Prymnesium_polylepis.1